MFENTLKLIKNDEIRKQTELAISKFPDYFEYAAASSTGKYHQSDENCRGGLERHSKRDVKVFLELSIIENFHLTQDEIDYGIAALICHDCCKYGENYGQYTVHNHPLLASKLIRENCSKEFADNVCPLVESHSGQWTTSKYSKDVLPKPTTMLQLLVHLSDYIASRRCVNIQLEETD